MYSCPGETSTGTMCPGSLVANANSPGAPMAAVLGHEDRSAASHALQDAEQASAAGELRVRCHLDGAPIQESSPASEMIVSFGSRMNSRTGMVVPVMRLCIAVSYVVVTWSEGFCSALRFYEIAEVVPFPNHQHKPNFSLLSCRAL